MLTRRRLPRMLVAMGDGVKWKWRDLFTTARAAGSVDGTSAEPGPETRVATDAESKMSISGGELVFSGGKATPVWGDPGLWYAARTRTPGEILVGKMSTGAVIGTHLTWGFDNAQSSLVGNYGIWAAQSNLAVNLGTGGIIIEPLTTNTDYWGALTVRSTGTFYFVQNGARAHPELIFVSDRYTSTPLYPAVTNYDSAHSMDNIGMPDVAAWFPTPLAYDTFTRSDGAIGTSETTGPDGQTVTARVWTVQSGVWAVSSNKAAATTAGIAALASVGSADVIYRAKLTTPGSGTTAAGMVLRYTDADNYWYVRVIPGTAGTDLQLIERNAGVETVRGSADVDWAVDTEYTISVRCVSNNYWYVFTDTGAAVTRRISYTSDNTFNYTASVFGLRDEGNSNFQFNDIEIYAAGTGGEYSYLAKFFR